MDAEPFDFDLRSYGPLVIVAIRGELDLATVDGVDRALQNIDLRPVTTVEVDLTAVTLLDSMAVGWLLRLDDRARQAATHLIVVADEDGPPHQTLRTSGVDGRLRLVLDRPRGKATA